MTTPDTTTPVPAEPVASPAISGEPMIAVAAEPAEPVAFVPRSEIHSPDDVPGGQVPYERKGPSDEAFANGTDTAEDQSDTQPNSGDEPAKWVHPEGWEHQWIEDFRGDRLAIKLPTRGMVNAIQHAGTTSLEFQQRLVAKFESEHISEPTRERVINRLTDADDPDYTGNEWDDLTTEILKTAAERMNKEDEELAKVKAPKSR